MKTLPLLIGIIFIANSLAGEKKRLWELKDGRASVQTASHIDGQSIYFVTGDNQYQRMDLGMLHDRDHTYALRKCDFQPQADLVEISGLKSYRSSLAWQQWLKTFVRLKDDGSLLLSADAKGFRDRILANVDDSEKLNIIRRELQQYRPANPAQLAGQSPTAPPPPVAPAPAAAPAAVAGAPAAGTPDYFFSFDDLPPAAAPAPPQQPAYRPPAQAPVYRPPAGQARPGGSGADTAKSDLERMKAERDRKGGSFKGPTAHGNSYYYYRGRRIYR